MDRDPHLSDEQIVRAIDIELPPAEAATAQRHLAGCWRCRARRAQFETAMSDFVRLRDGASTPEGTVSLLRARLRSEMPAPRVWFKPQFALATLGLLAAAALFFATGRSVQAGSLPNIQITPGATRSVTARELCNLAAADDRSIPAEVATRVFQQYGIQPRPKAYEVDYLIAPSLGGSDDIRNLWPQPYDGVWTAKVKDALEDYLRGEVCAGRIELGVAQRQIAGDWIAAYRRHFRVSKPLGRHAAFLKDRPWE